MRIIAGAFRGRRLHGPKGDRVRPTIDRVREAIFSMLASEIPNAKVLDLFAGTGAMGLEALSRGAAFSVFVDQSADSVRLIRENIALCRAEAKSRVMREPAVSAIRRLATNDEFFDIIFLDPPYGKGLIQETLAVLDTVAEAQAIVIAEHHIKDSLPATLGPWVQDRERKYGDTLISIYSRECSNQ